MRMRKGSGTNVMDMDMTPMIDMTFQLITFFMFVTNFANDLLDERVVLPVADHASPTEEAPQSPFYINMNASGSVFLPGGVVANPKSDPGPIRRQLSLESQLAKINMRASGADKEPEYRDGGVWTTVVIRAHKNAPYGTVQEVIKLAQEAGFTKFWLRANVNE